MFFRVILFGAPKPRVSVSALKRPVFCYLLIILFYLHLPNKIIFPHGLLISFHSFHYAQQGLTSTLQDFFVFNLKTAKLLPFLLFFCLCGQQKKRNLLCSLAR